MKPIWGAATSAHQVEGQNRWNDWWAWEQAGKVCEPSLIACDQYRLFREDFRLAHSLGHNAHRFSIEWSRLEPEEGSWNEEAFRHYEEVFDALKKEGLEPVVTLHHFTNPLWFAQKGGWLVPGAADKFSKYVEQVAKRFGRKARFWITFNEPLIYIYHSFVTGLWPPGEKSFAKAKQVVKELLRAHVQAYQILHTHSSGSDCWVSIAHHSTAFTPCRPGFPLDRLACFLRDWFINRLLFESLLSGFLFYPGVFSEKLSAKGTLDFLGVNYYTRNFVRFSGILGEKGLGEVCSSDHHPQETGERNDLGWEIFPRGIYEVVSSLKRFNLPILITENGVCGQDSLRERYIETHLAELQRARREKIEIFGYFYWSLVDNFEWAEGFKPRFGIVEVNYSNQERRPRPSAKALAKCCKNIFKETDGGLDAGGTF